ncbi:MAG: hypothetical protein KJ718_05460 [Nanoarchaeota archaeon]|nr:hypothetical protein [Nanoarchaeota archaeon]MBU1051970.1 hypothetical protein [Nanoarchaeota archaeon]MBU1988653.1 hypothetical protein [Nanoarchaeota archaeon]
MNSAFRTGMSFGVTSAVITTLGMIVGLNSGTHSKMVVVGGILMIAIADAFSDSLGIHLSEEARERHSKKRVWESTIFTFLFKFVFALTFLIPILLLDLSLAVKVNIVWGMLLLGGLSYYIAKKKNAAPWKVVTEHLVIAVVVIIATNFLGNWIAGFG